uniref:NADH dehydrogenase subunit 6 n=1 Tax=Monomachus antipodalis TaxID=161211 RepID=A0A0E3G876_9HYME|nr:NADH dehydrogenase subunit 6 [Monomachus antipodalis]
MVVIFSQMFTMNFFIYIYMFLIILLLNLKNFHPLILGIFLLLMTIFISMNLSFMKDMFWYTYLMFLVMVGGILVLFLYFASFSGNFKFSVNFKSYPILLMCVVLFKFLLEMIMYDFYSFLLIFDSLKNETLSIFSLVSLEKIMNFNYSLMMYIYPLNMMTLFTFMYLLLTLTGVVKMCMKYNFSLRKLKF